MQKAQVTPTTARQREVILVVQGGRERCKDGKGFGVKVFLCLFTWLQVPLWDMVQFLLGKLSYEGL